MNLIDVLIVGIILLGALQGYRKGLITGIASLAGSILGFAVASASSSSVYNWLISATPLSDWIEPLVYRAVLPFVQSEAAAVEQNVADKFLAQIPAQWGELFNHYLQNNGAIVQQQTLEQIGHTFARTITGNIIHIIAFAGVFLLVLVIVQIALSLILGPLGLFGGVLNSGGGLICGALGSFVVLSVLVGLIAPLLDLAEKATGQTMIQQALFYPYLLGLFHVLEHVFAAQLSQDIFNQLLTGSGISPLINK